MDHMPPPIYAVVAVAVAVIGAAADAHTGGTAGVRTALASEWEAAAR